jgi:hypothetical protein
MDKATIEYIVSALTEKANINKASLKFLNPVICISTGINNGAVKKKSFFSNSNRTVGLNPEIQNSTKYGRKGKIKTRFRINVFPIGKGLIKNAIIVNTDTSIKITFVTLSGYNGKANNARKSIMISK